MFKQICNLSKMNKNLNILFTLFVMILTACGSGNATLRVTLASNITSFDEAKVSLTLNKDKSSKTYTKIAQSNEIVFNDLKLGTYSLNIEHEDHFTYSEDIAIENKVTSYTANLKRNGPVVINVTQNFGDANGAKVIIRERNGYTQQKELNGDSAIFYRIQPGTYSIEITHDRYFPFVMSGFEDTSLVEGINVLLAMRGQAGGYVFLDKGNYANGWRYMELAPAYTEAVAQWGTYKVDVKDTLPDVGSGKKNTQLIFAKLILLGGSGRAVQLCLNLNVGGYNDWFLPSIYEMTWIDHNLNKKGLDNFQWGMYWSSTQYQSYNTDAYMYGFGTAGIQNARKQSEAWVRAIRAF